MVILRNFRKEDAMLLQAMRYPNLSVQETEKLIDEWNQKRVNDRYFEMFAVLAEETIVGTVSLYQQTSEVISIGPEIFRKYRQKGFGKEAMVQACRIAKEKGYKTVSQQIRTDNEASIALHTSLGYEANGLAYTNAKGNQVVMYVKCLV